jgi:hypothetical protein
MKIHIVTNGGELVETFHEEEFDDLVSVSGRTCFLQDIQ